MSDFSMTLKFNAPAPKLYDAIMNGDRWWTRNVSISKTPGSILDFQFPKADFYAKMKLLSVQPERVIEWECVDAKHSDKSGFDNLKDWVGTRLRFEIVPDGKDRAQLKFTHFQLADLECHGVCASAWSFYLNESLRAYVETGAGKPYDDATFGR